MNVRRSELWSKVEHFAKNRLQGLFGGSFLVESGLRSQDLDAINRGWGIVSNNQAEISRCIQHLITLGQPLPSPELVNLSLLITDVISEVEEFCHKTALENTIEFQPPTEATIQLCEPKSFRSALFGLLRICLEAGPDAQSSRTIIQLKGNSIRLQCQNPQFDFAAISNSENDLDPRVREAMLIEWNVANYAITDRQGKLQVRQHDSVLEFRIDFPTEHPT